jgi:hypothetical protein
MQNNGAGGAPRVYRNAWHCTVEIARHEGARGFFRGALTSPAPDEPYVELELTALNFDSLHAAVLTVLATVGPWWPPVMEELVRATGNEASSTSAPTPKATLHCASATPTPSNRRQTRQHPGRGKSRRSGLI